MMQQVDRRGDCVAVIQTYQYAGDPRWIAAVVKGKDTILKKDGLKHPRSAIRTAKRLLKSVPPVLVQEDPREQG